MSAGGWVALAGAGLLAGGGGARRLALARVIGLAAGGRLAATRAARRRGGPAWHPSLPGRRAAVARRDLRAAVGALTAELGAGGRPDAAFTAAAAAAPTYAPVFARAAETAGAGGDVADELRGQDATAGLACAWRLAESAGVPPAAVLDRVAADLDAAEEHRRSLAVALAGPRSSAAVLAGLPLVGLLLGTAMGGRPVAFLFGTPAGGAVGAIGLVLDAAGVLWIARILRRAAR